MHRRLVALAATAAAFACLPVASSQAAQIIVKPKPGAALGSLLAGTQQLGTVQANDALVLRVPGAAAPILRLLNGSGLVEYAEEDVVLRATATPNDPQFASMYGLQKISAPAGWDGFGLGGFPATGGFKVGIVDTGILSTHPELTGKTVNCAATTPGLLGIIGGNPTPQESRGCADDNGHGTHVAGTIAAATNNGVGVSGVSFNSPLAICKALHGAAGSGSTAGVANCITYLVSRGAKVISMSLGGGASTATLATAVQQATAQDVLIIAAAGNDGNANLNYPAADPEVVSVAATDQNDAKASFSNANADVEIAAPGVAIVSTWNNGGYNTISGTSMATPHVAGAAALIRSRGGTAAAARTKLQTSVDDLGPAGRDTSFGFGRLNLVKAAG